MLIAILATIDQLRDLPSVEFTIEIICCVEARRCKNYLRFRNLAPAQYLFGGGKISEANMATGLI